MALYGGMEAVGLYRQGAEKLSDGLFAGLTFLGVVLAAFCSLYLGTEYQDGTLRNKVAAGYRREQIYFSCLLACLGGGLLIWGSYLAAYLAVGLPLLGGEMGDWALVGGSCLGTLLLLMVYVCLYTCLVSWLQARPRLSPPPFCWPLPCCLAGCISTTVWTSLHLILIPIDRRMGR